MRQYRQDGNQSGGKEDYIVAPVKGLRTNTALAGMSPEYAVNLENVICYPDALVSRPGSADHATGLPTNSKTLMTYQSGTASEMFCARDGGVYNVTSPGAVGAAVATLLSGECSTTNFQTSAGQYLYCLSNNSLDDPLLYDGSAWTAITGVSSPALTGFDPTDLIRVASYRQRLFFIAQDRLSFFYLGVDAVGGALSEFRIGSLCTKGGYAVAMASWSMDGGDGTDDKFVICTSEGEVLLFEGSDPGVPANWLHIGTYDLGRPIGTRPFAKYGGDLLYLSDGGLYELSRYLANAGIARFGPLAEPVMPSLAGVARQYGAQKGWQLQFFPKFNVLLLNVPSFPPTQYVCQTLSRGWSTFSGWPCYSLAEFNGELYGSCGSAVRKLFTGTADGTSGIQWIIDCSYNRFKTLRQLHPLMIRPLVATTGIGQYRVGFAQDFSGIYNSQVVGATTGDAGLWDSAVWDTSLWGADFFLQKQWYTIAARPGNALSCRFTGTSSKISYTFIGADLKFARVGLIS